MKRYRVSQVASNDLNSIFVYWAERAGLLVADRLVDEITRRFWLLAEHPDAGVACDGIAAGVRSFSVGNYLIYYRKMRRGVEILHVFHGRQNHRKS